MSFLTSAFAFIKRHKWATAITIIIVVPIVLLVVYALKPSKPTYVTQPAVRGDLKQTVEAVGTVISDQGLSLQFPASGIVSAVYVKEGDTVHAGETLAQLRSGSLAADISSAQGRLLGAEASLQALLQGSRPEDIAISQADVQNKQSSLVSAQQSLATAQAAEQSAQQNLDALKQEAATSLSGYVSNVSSSTQQQLTTADIALSTMEDTFTKTDVVDAMVKYGSSEYDSLQQDMDTTRQLLHTISNSPSPADYTAALALLDQTRAAVQNASDEVDRAYALMEKLPVTSYFTEDSRSTYEAAISGQRTLVQGALADIDTTSKALRDASATYTTRITSAQADLTSAQGAAQNATADIATYQAALQTSQAELDLKKAPPLQTDIDSARANVQQAQAAVDAAEADYQNTVLTSPIDGTITQVNVKVGEVAPLDAAVTMLGLSPYRIEMYVSEVDIPKVQLSQTGSVELDAFRGTYFTLHVTDIDTASTDVDGVSKYRVRLDFAYPHNDLKVGMTGDAEIDTGLRTNVINIPLRSVIQSGSGQSIVRILDKNGTLEERPVTTGMESTDGNVEILSGVQEGEAVVTLVK